MIRWGVIGAGGFASVRPIPALKQARDCQMVAVMDIVDAKGLAEKHKAPKYYDKLEDLLDDSEVDAVYIATPVFLHKKHTIAAAEKGKHILCEKPMALTLKDCRQMIDACKENGVKLGIGYMRRFHPYHQEIKRIIDNGKLGKIVLARVQTHLWYQGDENAWRKKRSLGGGGAFADMGSHCLELLQFFLGKVVSVNSTMTPPISGDNTDETAVITLMFENGCIGIIDNSFSIPFRRNVVEIYGTKGTLLAAKTAGPFNDPQLHLINEGGDQEIKPQSESNQYQTQFEQFARCIMEDKSPPVDSIDGLENLKVILAVYEAAEKGRVIEIEK